MALTREKIEEKIKELNEIRRIYKRDFEEIEKSHKAGDISDVAFEKKKAKYEKRKEKIRKKIHDLEEKLEQLKEE